MFMLQKASDSAKWGEYVHILMSGTQGVKKTTFCVGTQALLLGYQAWRAPGDLCLSLGD